MTIIIKTEARDVPVELKEHAYRMIEATAFSMQLKHEELKSFDEVQRLAGHFNIDTNELKIFPNEDVRDQEQGFWNTYKF